MKKINDLSYGEHPLQKLDIYLPDAKSVPLLIYFHGGGLTEGDKSQQAFFCSFLAEQGVAVANVNYRLLPEVDYPAPIEDAAKAIDWICKSSASYLNLQKIYIGGSSAGGYLSQMLCFDPQWLGAYQRSPLDFAGFIHDAGQPTCHFNLLKERGLDHRRVMIDETAPLFHIGTATEYPPMLIIVSDNDMQNRFEQTMLLCSTLKHFGHEDKISLKIMRGKHCAYLRAADEAGASVFGKIILNFIGDQS